jgi:hypothetical protein
MVASFLQVMYFENVQHGLLPSRLSVHTEACINPLSARTGKRTGPRLSCVVNRSLKRHGTERLPMLLYPVEQESRLADEGRGLRGAQGSPRILLKCIADVALLRVLCRMVAFARVRCVCPLYIMK